MLDDPFIDEILMIQFFSICSLKSRLELVREYLDKKRPQYSKSSGVDKKRIKQLSDAVNVKIAQINKS